MTNRINLKTAVFLCTDLESLGYGLDLREVQRGLQEAVPGVHVHLVPNLSQRPQEIARAVEPDGVTRLVLGLCSEEFAAAKMQVQARKAGLDPLGVEVVNLGAYTALARPQPRSTEKAKILLTAAVARACAFPGSRPENAQPSLSSRVSRRSLFTLSLMEYRPVPSIRGRRCAAGSGCKLCAQACPCGAIESLNGRVRLDKSRCEGCGVCLTTCPKKAIRFPGYAPAQLAAQIATLLDPTVGTLQPRGILFTCQKSALARGKLAQKRFPAANPQSPVSDSEVELLPVEAPCLGMVPPTWLLGCLTSGAAAVRLVQCPGPCSLAQKEVIEGRTAYCRELLRCLGGSPDRIRLLPVTDLKEQRSGRAEEQGRVHLALAGSLPCTGGHQPAAETLLHLAEAYGMTEGLSLAHPYSPFGRIEVTDNCTGCGVCATACPTDALTFTRENGEVSLTFDTALCTACGQCPRRCPEEAIHLQRITDFQRLLQGRAVLYRDRDRRCAGCGAPIAPGAMLQRVKEALGGKNTPVLRTITRYCPDCRMKAGSSPSVPVHQHRSGDPRQRSRSKR